MLRQIGFINRNEWEQKDEKSSYKFRLGQKYNVIRDKCLEVRKTLRNISLTFYTKFFLNLRSFPFLRLFTLGKTLNDLWYRPSED